VCSVRGLYCAFPSLDLPVYVRPQLKPPYGICTFTTMTFGAHRGADQGAGRSTSRRDLYCLLGGSTSASPPSTVGLLQLPGLTSTRPGRHTVVPDLHQRFRAGIFFPRPVLIFLGLAYICPGQHIYVPADICGPGVSSGASRLAYIFSWPVFLPAGQNKAVSAFSGRSAQDLGRHREIPAGWACQAESRRGPERVGSGGPDLPPSWPAHPGLSTEVALGRPTSA
jgi:hypothetical protein